MKLYTIGFTQKNAKSFFESIAKQGIQRLVDIRLNPGGQLSGFAKQSDLPYFLSKLSNGCIYEYLPILAPTKEILKDYRANKNWQQYEIRFEALMDERKIPSVISQSDFLEYSSCLLCSEATPEQCHRRLVAERMAKYWGNVKIVHL
jgi:uncharacterized protein (DUF488 family)